MYIDKDKYTSHINDPIKKIGIRQILDKIEIVLNNHIIQFTDFLDPYEVYLAKSVLNRFIDLEYIIEGGFESSERKIIIIYPEYIFKEDIDIPITSLKINGDLRDINHKDYLGSLLSLGIQRNKIGDILVYEHYAIVLVKKEISNYIIYNLDKVRNINVETSLHTLNSIEPPNYKYKEINKFLTSLRLDVIISATFNISRKESINIIKAGNIKVNWENVKKPSKEVEEKDLISVKGFGRFTLNEIKGRSKSNRIICIIRIIL